MTDRRRSRRRQLDASHQRNWLIGRHAVVEVVLAGIWPIRRLCATAEALEHLSELPVHHAAGLPDVEEVASDRLTELCGSRHHQGVAAQMGEFPYGTLEDLPALLTQADDAPLMPPLIVICDRLQDAHNLGAIIRSCDAMAVAAVIIGEREQAGVTPQVARSSAGAVNHCPVIRVRELDDAVAALKDGGSYLLAASEKAVTPISDVDSSHSTGLIIGSEARGVSPHLLEQCDQQVSIPMHGQVGSLNAAVAAGVLLYELRRGVS